MNFINQIREFYAKRLQIGKQSQKNIKKNRILYFWLSIQFATSIQLTMEKPTKLNQPNSQLSERTAIALNQQLLAISTLHKRILP
jgi:hypothetical protein